MVTVVELNYYPVKGCAGIAVSNADLTPAGLAHDRTFMVVGEDGTFRSQRRDPRLAIIRPAVTPSGDRITVNAPGTAPLSVEVRTEVGRREVTLFGEPYQGIDQGDEMADWFSEVLGERSRLVRVPPDHQRVIDGWVPGTSGYADSCPVLLLSRSSLDGLSERITEHGGRPVPMRRFRPNIVVDGWADPHTEDAVRRFTVGDTELGFNRQAIRCAVVMVDQDSGERVGPEPLQTLARYRRAPEGGVAFGTKFAVVRPGKVSIGDEVTVSQWG
ncbi:MAG: MOSC N-terminal beta barrel domain-containing protein [Actinomycetota bacterium]|nr:MOSC N-terminal beta barrel domain-containing protein [Actinomycetota bacterium]